MILLAAVLTASINIDIDLTDLIRRHTEKQPKVTCGISTVGYRFVGKPGQEFRYAGDTYQVPSEGFVELIADKHRTSYTYSGKTLELDSWPKNQFGFREVSLPSSDQILKGEESK